jgi:hypothetical protein
LSLRQIVAGGFDQTAVLALFCCFCRFVLQDELLNVIYWWRQVAGVVIGILLGLGNVTGLMGIIV